MCTYYELLTKLSTELTNEQEQQGLRAPQIVQRLSDRNQKLYHIFKTLPGQKLSSNTYAALRKVGRIEQQNQ